ncbi:hypothetical protein ACFL2G_00035 [Candidatus Omnitrophota bacterium]
MLKFEKHYNLKIVTLITVLCFCVYSTGVYSHPVRRDTLRTYSAFQDTDKINRIEESCYDTVSSNTSIKKFFWHGVLFFCCISLTQILLSSSALSQYCSAGQIYGSKNSRIEFNRNTLFDSLANTWIQAGMSAGRVKSIKYSVLFNDYYNLSLGEVSKKWQDANYAILSLINAFKETGMSEHYIGQTFEDVLLSNFNRSSDEIKERLLKLAFFVRALNAYDVAKVSLDRILPDSSIQTFKPLFEFKLQMNKSEQCGNIDKKVLPGECKARTKSFMIINIVTYICGLENSEFDEAVKKYIDASKWLLTMHPFRIKQEILLSNKRNELLSGVLSVKGASGFIASKKIINGKLFYLIITPRHVTAQDLLVSIRTDREPPLNDRWSQKPSQRDTLSMGSLLIEPNDLEPDLSFVIMAEEDMREDISYEPLDISFAFKKSELAFLVGGHWDKVVSGCVFSSSYLGDNLCVLWGAFDRPLDSGSPVVQIGSDGKPVVIGMIIQNGGPRFLKFSPQMFTKYLEALLGEHQDDFEIAKDSTLKKIGVELFEDFLLRLELNNEIINPKGSNIIQDSNNLQNSI